MIANSAGRPRIPLEIIRGGRRATVIVTVAQRPTEEALAKLSGAGTGDRQGTVAAPAAPQRALGLSLTPLTPDLARAASLPASAHGVIITAVDPNANAAEQGLQRGDLIVSVNNQPVTSPAQVIALVDAARKAGRTSVLLLVQRGNAPPGFVGVNITGQVGAAQEPSRTTFCHGLRWPRNADSLYPRSH